MEEKLLYNYMKIANTYFILPEFENIERKKRNATNHKKNTSLTIY